jgi:hypothetical protein
VNAILFLGLLALLFGVSGLIVRDGPPLRSGTRRWVIWMTVIILIAGTLVRGAGLDRSL